MTGVPMERGNLDTDMHSGRTPCEDGGIGQGDASISQGRSETASKPADAKGEAWNRAYPQKEAITLIP